MVMLRALEVPQPDSGRRSRREHVYDPAASRLLHHGTTMSDKKSTDEKAVEEFDEELSEGSGDDEFEPDDVADSGDPKGDDEDNEDDGNDEAGPKPTAGSEDDEDEPDPSDVEADLAGILRDRIAAGDDEDDEEEEGEVALVPASGDVEGRRESEIHCPNCFLLVTTDTVTDTGECPHCGGSIP